MAELMAWTFFGATGAALIFVGVVWTTSMDKEERADMLFLVAIFFGVCLWLIGAAWAIDTLLS